MTFIQPNKKNHSLVNALLVFLVVMAFGATFAMVALYNSTVNASHNIAAAKSALEATGAENTTLNNEILAMLGSGANTDLATTDGLVLDQAPQYFSVNQSWPLASQF